MTLHCPACDKDFDAGPSSWPGDHVACPHCGASVDAARAATDVPELSPPQAPEPEPELAAGSLLGPYRIEGLAQG